MAVNHHDIIYRSGPLPNTTSGVEIVVTFVHSGARRSDGSLAQRPCVCHLVPAFGPYPERLETLVLFDRNGGNRDDVNGALECAKEMAAGY